MHIVIAHHHGHQCLGYASSVPAVAAALRAGGPVHVRRGPDATTWSLTIDGDHVAVTALNPPLFTFDPADNGWIERLAASVAALI